MQSHLLVSEAYCSYRCAEKYAVIELGSVVLIQAIQSWPQLSRDRSRPCLGISISSGFAELLTTAYSSLWQTGLSAVKSFKGLFPSQIYAVSQRCASLLGATGLSPLQTAAQCAPTKGNFFIVLLPNYFPHTWRKCKRKGNAKCHSSKGSAGSRLCEDGFRVTPMLMVARKVKPSIK